MKKTDLDYASLKAELDSVLAKLQDETTDIDDALKGYERGIDLTKQLTAYLKTAENKITRLQAAED